MFFSVKAPIKIAGKVFQPCICYEVTKVIELNVEKLVAEGKAVKYEERVFFQNGKVIEAVKPAPKAKKTPKKEEVKEEVKEEGF